MTALIIVDLQNDFMPGGALPAHEGDAILPAINRLLDMNFDLIVATKDWHPEQHGSFAATHGKAVHEKIVLNDLEQILWPVHCVQGTHGAEFAPGWEHGKVHKTFFKGIEKNTDSYSTFFDNAHRRSTGLHDFLKEYQISTLYIAGLATDYCVKFSVLDAIDLGFEIFVVTDACHAVNINPEDEIRALQEMERAGAHLVKSHEVKI